MFEHAGTRGASRDDAWGPAGELRGEGPDGPWPGRDLPAGEAQQDVSGGGGGGLHMGGEAAGELWEVLGEGLGRGGVWEGVGEREEGGLF